MENTPANGVTTQIILGKPNDGCAGHGICRILTQSFSSSFKCPAVTAIISKGEDRKLQINFPKSTMSPLIKEKHFSGPWFKIEERFLLPGRIRAHFQYQNHYIMPGNFQITENNQYFIIKF